MSAEREAARDALAAAAEAVEVIPENHVQLSLVASHIGAARRHLDDYIAAVEKETS